MKHWDEVYIGEFTGPLDLLVTMIKDKKISIMDVNLIDLADQYVNYINSQQKLDIEIASEYLSMAAQLIEMKSHLLLPRENDGLDVEDEYNYEDFLEQLTRYEQIKSVTDFFVNRQTDYLSTFSKNKSKTNFSFKIAQEKEDELMVDPLNIDMEDFAQIFKKVMMQAEMRNFDNSDLFEEEFNTISTDVISPQEIANMIVEKMKANKIKRWRMEELIDDNILNLKNLISTFLAILDLVRHQIATVEQYENTLIVQFSKEVLNDESILESLEVQSYD